MKTKKLLNELYFEQKTTNRHLQQLSNLMLLGILTKVGKMAKEKEDEVGIMLCKVGLSLTVVVEMMLLWSSYLDDKRKKLNERFIELEEEEER